MTDKIENINTDNTIPTIMFYGISGMGGIWSNDRVPYTQGGRLQPIPEQHELFKKYKKEGRDMYWVDIGDVKNDYITPKYYITPKKQLKE